MGDSPDSKTVPFLLQYKNVRPDYVKEVWKVVNWNNVGENLAKAK